MFLSTSEVVTQRSWGLRDVGLAALHKTPQTTVTAVIVKLLYPVLRGCPSRDRWDYVHLNLFCVSFKYYFHWILTCLLYAGVVPVWGQHLSRWHPCVLTVFENLLPHQRVLRRHRPLWMGPAPTHQPAGRGGCKGSQKNIDPPSLCGSVWLSRITQTRLVFIVVQAIILFSFSRWWALMCCVRLCRSTQTEVVFVRGSVPFVSSPSLLLITPQFISWMSSVR